MYHYFKNVCDHEKILTLLGSQEWFPFETYDTKRLETRFIKSSKNPDLYVYIQSILDNISFNSKVEDNSIHPRKYIQDSYIDWHKDYEHAPDKPYEEWEGVLVLSNTSDSVTEFWPEQGERFSIKTFPGDLLLIKRKGIKHRVTSITNNGERMILKFQSRLN